MTKEYAQANEETVVKFLRAMRNSALDILASDPAVILDRITAKYDFVANEDRDFRIAAIKAYNDMTVANGEANVMRNVEEVVAKSAELASRAGIVDLKDVKGTYTNQYIDARSPADRRSYRAACRAAGLRKSLAARLRPAEML